MVYKKGIVMNRCTYSVIENIVHGHFLKLTKTLNLNPLIKSGTTDPALKAILSDDFELMIGQEFLGLQGVYDNQIHIHIDYPRDSIVGNEPALIFKKINK